MVSAQGWVFGVTLALALVGMTEVQQTGKSAAREFLEANGVTSASPLYQQALETWLEAEAAYLRHDYHAADRVLKSLWERHPPATEEWAAAYRESGTIKQSAGVNIGSPPCYYALRMLTECVRWRLSSNAAVKPVAKATLTVVLVGKTRGIEPRTMEELKEGRGIEVTHTLEPGLGAPGNSLIRESLWLFLEYMRAATDGKLDVRVQVERLPDLEVPVSVTSVRYRHAGLSGDAWRRIWSAVSDRVKQRTDWWWVLYPSCVPDQYPDFERTEFITGGMGTGPDGVSPCFIIDDRWLTRKPPHLGKGPYSSIERRAYLPQWLQHEFFHHIFRTYPEFKLEARDHQWFDRTTWPSDFIGVIEPDYYWEALHKRIKPLAKPPMHVALRYAPPPLSLFSRAKLSELTGAYVREPVENDWHVGTLELVAADREPRLKWTNRAGVSWVLRPDLRRGLLLTGTDCPYHDPRNPDASAFRLRLRRDEDGRWLPEIEGFAFQGGIYRLKANPSGGASTEGGGDRSE